MIIQAFLRWTERAAAGDRAKAAGSLAKAYARGRMSFEDRHAAEAALSFLLDDPSPKVRLAIAAALARSDAAPRSIIHALSRDQIEVASHVVAFSPVLGDGDLVDIVAEGTPEIQRVVAMRPRLSVAVSAAIAEIGTPDAVGDLLDNPGADIATISIRRIAERFAAVAEIRSRLLERRNLPCDVRHQMVVSVGAALADFSLVRSTIGAHRVRNVTEDACQQATLHLAASVAAAEMPALLEHLRIGGQLTPALLMHTLCQGNVDFFAAAIVSLSGQNSARVRGLLVDGRVQAIGALYAAAGISPSTAAIFVSATLIWRDATRKGKRSSAGAVADRLMDRHVHDAAADSEVADLLMLVEKLNLDFRRRAARDTAIAMAARAA